MASAPRPVTPQASLQTFLFAAAAVLIMVEAGRARLTRLTMATTLFQRLGSLRLGDPSRAEFDGAVSESDLQQLAGLSTVKTLQCSSPVKDPVWSLLNDRFFSVRPDVELRVYGHYSTECDLSFAGRMTRVRRFAADCLMRARNVEAIADMPHLEALS